MLRKKTSLDFKRNFPDILPSPVPLKNVMLHEPISAGLATFFFSSLGLTGGISLFGSFFGFASLAASGTIMAAMIGASFAMSALAKSKMPGGAPSPQIEQGILVNTQSTTAIIPLGYGQSRAGGNICMVNESGDDNIILDVIMTLCAGPIEGWVTDAGGDKVWLNDSRASYYEDFEGTRLFTQHLRYGTIKKRDYAALVTTAAVAGVTSIIVSSTARMRVDEEIGLVLDNTTEHWTTIDSITDATHVVIHDAIPTGRSSPIGARVYNIQVPLPGLVERLPRFMEAHRGVAYVHGRLVFNPEAWHKFPLITGEGKWKRIKDTRDSTIAWTQNRALVAYDYMIDPINGMGIPESMIDSTSVNDAAIWCAANNYFFDGLYGENNEAGDILKDLLGPRLDYVKWGGTYKFIIYTDAASVMTLGEDDIIVKSLEGHVPGISDTPTRLKVWFFDKTDNYSKKSLYLDDYEGEPAPITDDDERVPEAVLWGIVDYEDAVTLGKYIFMRSRFNRTWSCTGKARCMNLTPGDMVSVTHSFPGWTAQKLRVVSAGMTSGAQIPLSLMEEDPIIYDPTVEVAVHEAFQSTLPNSRRELKEPTNLNAITGPDETTANKHDAFLRFEWDYKGKSHDYDLFWRKLNAEEWQEMFVKAPHGDVGVPEFTGAGSMGMIASGDSYVLVDTIYKVEIDGNYTTLIRVQANAGDTTIQVNASSSLYLNQLIGIELDNGTIHWSTITEITDADTIKIDDAIPAGRHADAGADVYPQTFRWSDSDGAVWDEEDVPVRSRKNPLMGFVTANGTTLANETHEANNATAGDMNLMRASPVANDARYFGSDKPFSILTLVIGTAGAGVWTQTWEYWNSEEWIALTITEDEIDNFRAAAGARDLKFSIPGAWEKCTVGGKSAFWIRARLSSYTSKTVTPLGTSCTVSKPSDWCELNNGVVVTFDALIGATVGDYWRFTAKVPNPVKKRISGVQPNAEIEWKVRSSNMNGRKSNWLHGINITSWGPVVPTMAGYTPDVSVIKPRILKAVWKGWEGFGDRIKAAMLDDGGVFTDYSVPANNDTTNDVNLLPATPAVNDAFYFGSLYPFIKIMLNMGTQGSGVWTIIWEYYNGSAWTALSKVTIGNPAQFKAAAGERVIEFAYPTDWAQVAVNSVTCYWVRARVSAYTSKTTQPKARKIRIENLSVKDYDVYCSTDAACPVVDDNIVARAITAGQTQFTWQPGTEYFVRVRPNGWGEPGTESEVFG